MANPDREELVKFDLFTPDELAVRLDEWANCLDKAQMDLRSDLRCAAIHLRRLASSDGGVKVRELEWVERTGVAGTFDASTSVGHYIATITDDGRGMWFIIGLTTSNYTIGDIDVVRAAAQADYEARIRSALETGWHLAPAHATSGDGVIEAAVAEIEERFAAAIRAGRGEG